MSERATTPIDWDSLLPLLGRAQPSLPALTAPAKEELSRLLTPTIEESVQHQLRAGADPELVADVTQDAWVELLSRIGEGPPFETPLRTMVQGIVRRAVGRRSVQRRANEIASGVDLDSLCGPPLSGEPDPAAMELAEILRV